MTKIHSIEILVDSLESLSTRGREIAAAPVRQFLSKNKKYFEEKRIGDLGAGETIAMKY